MNFSTLCVCADFNFDSLEEDPDILCVQGVFSAEEMNRIRSLFPFHHAQFKRRWEPYTLWFVSFFLLYPSPWPFLPLSLFFLWVCFRGTSPFNYLVGEVGGILLLSKYTFLRVGGGGIFHSKYVWGDVGEIPICIVGGENPPLNRKRFLLVTTEEIEDTRMSMLRFNHFRVYMRGVKGWVDGDFLRLTCT